MIHVDFVRCGLHVVAINVKDDHTVTLGVGFTRAGALKRLLKTLDERENSSERV